MAFDTPLIILVSMDLVFTIAYWLNLVEDLGAYVFGLIGSVLWWVTAYYWLIAAVAVPEIAYVFLMLGIVDFVFCMGDIVAAMLPQKTEEL